MLERGCLRRRRPSRCYDVVVIDGEEASEQGDVSALQAQGLRRPRVSQRRHDREVAGWYPDAQALPALRVAGLEGRVVRRRLEERAYATHSQTRSHPDILAKGFDGLFLDNVDMIEPKRHRRQRDGMRELVARLGDLVHSDGRPPVRAERLLGLSQVRDPRRRPSGRLEPGGRDLDVRLRQARSTCATRTAIETRRWTTSPLMRDRGLFTTATNYTKRSTGPAVDESIEDACSVGALPFIGDIGLTAKRLPDSPYVCP